MDITQFKNIKYDRQQTDSVIDKEIARIFDTNEDFRIKYANWLLRSDFAELRPWLYRALVDQVKCQSCPGYFICPKNSRRGFYYDVDLRQKELINKICEKKIEINKYKPFLIYGEDNYENCMRIFLKMSTYREDIKNPQLSFSKVIKQISLAIKNLAGDQKFYIQTTNENKKILAFFLAAFSLKHGCKTAIIDPSKRLNFLRLDNNQSDIDEVLNLQSELAQTQVVVIDNFDTFKRYSSTLDNLVFPLVKSALGLRKILIMTGEDSLASAISISTSGKMHLGLQKKLADTKQFVFDEPVLFNI